MRYLILAVAVLMAGTATPTLAAKRQVASTPTFYECYQLAWLRGVHVEYGELPAFNELCFANKIPFDSGYPSGSVKRGSK